MVVLILRPLRLVVVGTVGAERTEGVVRGLALAHVFGASVLALAHVFGAGVHGVALSCVLQIELGHAHEGMRPVVVVTMSLPRLQQQVL